MLICDGLNFDEILVLFYWWNMTCMLTRCEYDKWSNWWCHVARMDDYASILLYEFKILSINFSLAWLHNSSAISWHHPINHLLLQLCRWLALTLEQAPTKVAMMVTYYHRRHHLWMISLHSSWVIKEPWRIHYASLRRTQRACQQHQGPEPNQHSSFNDF